MPVFLPERASPPLQSSSTPLPGMSRRMGAMPESSGAQSPPP
jgi:hypothetical protein